MLEPQSLAANDAKAEKPADKPDAPAGRRLSAPAIGAGVAIGSAAIAAALIYWNRSKPAASKPKGGDATD